MAKPSKRKKSKGKAKPPGYGPSPYGDEWFRTTDFVEVIGHKNPGVWQQPMRLLSLLNSLFTRGYLECHPKDPEFIRVTPYGVEYFKHYDPTEPCDVCGGYHDGKERLH